MQALLEKLVKISLHRTFNKLTSEHLQLRALQLRSQLVLLGLKHVTWVKRTSSCISGWNYTGDLNKKQKLKEKTNNKNHKPNKNKPQNKQQKHTTKQTKTPQTTKQRHKTFKWFNKTDVKKQPSKLICKN